MTIEVRLFATLREGRGKKQKLELESSQTVRAVIQKLDIKEEEIALLLLNGIDGRLDSVLKEGDTLSLFPPVGGG